MESGADAVIFDLEDAVAPPAKDYAVSAVADMLANSRNGSVERWVRINSGSRGLSDLQDIQKAETLTGAFIPKATEDWLTEVLPFLQRVRVCALIESARGVLQVAEIASMDGVDQIALGEADLVADLAITPSSDGRELWPIRLSAVVACSASERIAPIGPVWLDTRDSEGLRRSTIDLRKAGFRSRQAIHPGQVQIINDAMTPTAEEQDEARRLLKHAEEVGTSASVDGTGRMVDEAVLRSARRLLDG
jgi:citrate lyase subunit beta / citryl-CoA lyase